VEVGAALVLSPLHCYTVTKGNPAPSFLWFYKNRGTCTSTATELTVTGPLCHCVTVSLRHYMTVSLCRRGWSSGCRWRGVENAWVLGRARGQVKSGACAAAAPPPACPAPSPSAPPRPPASPSPCGWRAWELLVSPSAPGGHAPAALPAPDPAHRLSKDDGHADSGGREQYGTQGKTEEGARGGEGGSGEEVWLEPEGCEGEGWRGEGARAGKRPPTRRGGALLRASECEGSLHDVGAQESRLFKCFISNTN